MHQNVGPIVYILGAGCSIHCGYPLASGFLSALDNFNRILIAPNVQRIQGCVSNTAALLRKHGYQTIDELVDAINNGVLDRPEDRNAIRRIRDEKIHQAKVATAALFHWLEPAARKTGLPRYTEFLREILPENDWRIALQNSKVRVLTFNYERLFEMAFVRRFGVNQTVDLYGAKVLNSGLNPLYKDAILFEPDKFCFLKLHGSIAFSAREEYGKPCHYYEYCDPIEDRIVTDGDLFDEPGKRDPRNWPLEPLIVFPHERNFVMSSKNAFPFRIYINEVWKQAETVIASAAEIRVIGYSFAATDRTRLVALLATAKNCKRIIIKGPDADAICQMLSIDHPELPAKSFPARF